MKIELTFCVPEPIIQMLTYLCSILNFIAVNASINGSWVVEFFTQWCKTASTLNTLNTVAQSICTHYSSLSGRPDIFLGSGTGKKSGPKKSRVQKNQVIVIQKEKRPDCLFSF